MQYILSLLPLLACPVGMGLMIWLMMRGNKQDQAPQRTDPLPASAYRTPVEATHESPRRNSPLQMLFMCLNWKVVAGLAVVGVIIWALAPQFLLGAIPLLMGEIRLPNNQRRCVSLLPLSLHVMSNWLNCAPANRDFSRSRNSSLARSARWKARRHRSSPRRSLWPARPRSEALPGSSTAACAAGIHSQGSVCLLMKVVILDE